MRKNSLICVGTIGRPKGLKGEFFLNSFCSPAENIIDYIEDIKINDEDLKLQYIKKNNTKFLSKIMNIDDLETIKGYTNTKLFISSDNLPILSSDEIYWHQLVGMLVFDINKDELLGKVSGLNNFGSTDCLIIDPTNDSIDNKERIIPFIRETFIKKIDQKKQIIEVNWQKDY